MIKLLNIFHLNQSKVTIESVDHYPSKSNWLSQTKLTFELKGYLMDSFKLNLTNKPLD